MLAENVKTIILKERCCGVVRISFSEQPKGLTATAESAGLSTRAESYIEIGREKARDILVYLLHKDLAYGSEIIPLKRASEIADLVFLDFQEGEATFLSNSDWKNNELSTWNPATQATFDSGIIAIGKKSSFCIWFEDED